jgi:multicomponent Na+:H+ antiporter subunit F
VTIAFTVALAMLAAAAGITVGAALRGPTSADRVLAVDLLLVILAGGLAVGAAAGGRPDLLVIVVVVALVAFVGTVAVGRALERSGRR